APDPPASRPTNLPDTGHVGSRPSGPVRWRTAAYATSTSTLVVPRQAVGKGHAWSGGAALPGGRHQRSSWFAALVCGIGLRPWDAALGRGWAGRGVGPAGSGPSTLGAGAPGRW